MTRTHILVLWLVALFTLPLLSSSAMAADPECDNLNAPVDVIDATSGGFSYCTSQIDSKGNPYPLTGYPMECEVRNGVEILDVQSGLAPGQLVEVTGLLLRWQVDPIDIACSNIAGMGAVFARPALFPAETPGTPYVPGP